MRLFSRISAGINSAISGALTTYEIMVFAIYDNHKWDIVLDLEAEQRRAPGGGYVCDLCQPDARAVFTDRPALWTDHLFQGLFLMPGLDERQNHRDDSKGRGRERH